MKLREHCALLTQRNHEEAARAIGIGTTTLLLAEGGGRARPADFALRQNIVPEFEMEDFLVDITSSAGATWSKMLHAERGA